MGWNISHGTNEHGEMRRSYTTVHNIAQHVANALSGAEWQRLRPLLQRKDGHPFEVPPHVAAASAELLRKAAASPVMPREWAAEAQEMAEAANRAAARGELWMWR